MRLQACMVRRAIRKAAKKIHSQISDAGSARGSMLFAAAAMIHDFVNGVCRVMDAMQEVCSICNGRGFPQDLVEGWALCEEWLLVEAERAILRLIRDLDSCMPVSRRGGDCSAEGLRGWQISAVKRAESPPLSPLDGMEGDGRAKQGGLLGGGESSQEPAGVPRAEFGVMALGHSPADPAVARAQLQHAALSFQNARRQKGYVESLIKIGDAFGNEHYTQRIKVLKRHAQEAISLLPKVKQRSQLLDDAVGAVVAAIAMVVAVFGMWVGYCLANYQLDIKFAIITVIFYSIKDRIKKWGERYLEPVALWFGCSFPDRIVELVDEHGAVVGKCDETCKTRDAHAVDKPVRDMRWQEHQSRMHREQAALLERVLHLSKSMVVRWDALTPPLRDGCGLDDIMRIDLRHFCRRMEPASEPQFCMRQGPDGNFTVDKLPCSRVYHIEVVVRITQHPTSRGRNSSSGDTCMQLDRTRLVLDQGGLLRLEDMGSRFLSKEGEGVPSQVHARDVRSTSQRGPVQQTDLI